MFCNLFNIRKINYNITKHARKHKLGTLCNNYVKIPKLPAYQTIKEAQINNFSFKPICAGIAGK